MAGRKKKGAPIQFTLGSGIRAGRAVTPGKYFDNVYEAQEGQFKARGAQISNEIGFKLNQVTTVMDKLLKDLGQCPQQVAESFEVLSQELFREIAQPTVGLNPGTPFLTGRASFGWTYESLRGGEKNKWKWFFQNLVPYIGYLELGYSSKAPQGMVRIALERYRAKYAALREQIGPGRKLAGSY